MNFQKVVLIIALIILIILLGFSLWASINPSKTKKWPPSDASLCTDGEWACPSSPYACYSDEDKNPPCPKPQ